MPVRRAKNSIQKWVNLMTMSMLLKSDTRSMVQKRSVCAWHGIWQECSIVGRKVHIYERIVSQQDGARGSISPREQVAQVINPS